MVLIAGLGIVLSYALVTGAMGYERSEAFHSGSFRGGRHGDRGPDLSGVTHPASVQGASGMSIGWSTRRSSSHRAMSRCRRDRPAGTLVASFATMLRLVHRSVGDSWNRVKQRICCLASEIWPRATSVDLPHRECELIQSHRGGKQVPSDSHPATRRRQLRLNRTRSV